MGRVESEMGRVESGMGTVESSSSVPEPTHPLPAAPVNPAHISVRVRVEDSQEMGRKWAEPEWNLMDALSMAREDGAWLEHDGMWVMRENRGFLP